MAKRTRSYEPGAPPGQLPVEQVKPPKIEIIDIAPEVFSREPASELRQGIEAPPPGVTRWIRVAGVPDAGCLARIGELFGVHALVLEDLASSEQRIKTEGHETYTYTIIRTPQLGLVPEARDLELDLVLTDRVLLSVGVANTDEFLQPIFRRLANARSLLRKGGPDTLYYALFDLAVDCYFPAVEQYEEAIDALETAITDRPQHEHIDEIHRLRSDIRHIRSTLWATRDVTAEIVRNGTYGMSERTTFYFRDVHDHVIHLLDTVTDLREGAGSLRELHSSELSSRMNEVMKVLTIIATIFIPITFVAGIYGMNFQNMPELTRPWGYYGVLGLMGLIIVGMIIFFKRRKWF